MNRIEDLEEAWLQWMRQFNKPEALLTKNTKRPNDAIAARQQPSLGQPVIRGASPDDAARRSGPVASDGWSPNGNPQQRGPVQLMPPETDDGGPPLAQRALQKQPR